MADAFQNLSRGRPPLGVGVGLWVRRAFMVVFAAIAVAALANVFGERASESGATGAAASLRLSAPERVRGGLFFESRR